MLGVGKMTRNGFGPGWRVYDGVLVLWSFGHRGLLQPRSNRSVEDCVYPGLCDLCGDDCDRHRWQKETDRYCGRNCVFVRCLSVGWEFDCSDVSQQQDPHFDGLFDGDFTLGATAADGKHATLSGCEKETNIFFSEECFRSHPPCNLQLFLSGAGELCITVLCQSPDGKLYERIGCSGPDDGRLRY